MVSLLADSQLNLLLVEHIKSEQILLFLRAVAVVQGAMSTKLGGFGNSKIIFFFSLLISLDCLYKVGVAMKKIMEGCD